MSKKIFAVVSGKGGVGKTTLVSLLGLALNRKDKKVLLIDADLGLTNLEIILHAHKNEYDLQDVINGTIELEKAYQYLTPNLALLTLYKHIKIEDFEVKKNIEMFPKIIENFEYIIIDSPSGIEKGFEFSSLCAQKIFVVINQTFSSLSDAIKVENLLKNKYKKPYSFILNRVGKKNMKIFLSQTGYIKDKISFYIKEDEKIFKEKLQDEKLLELIYTVIENEERKSI